MWPFLSLPAKCKDWKEEIWLNRGLNQPSALGWSSRNAAALDLPWLESPCWCGWTDTISLHHLQPSTSLQPLTALPSSSTQSCCGVSSIPGCLGHWGSVAGPQWLQGGQWAGGHSSWRAIPDSQQVDGAAGGQHQTGSRWRGQQEGNTTLYSTWH